MKQTTRDTIDCLLYVVSFLLFQFVVHQAVKLIVGADALSGTVFLAISALTSVLTIAFFVWRGWSPFSRTYINTQPWGLLFWTVCLSVGLIVPCELLQEALGANLPDQMRTMFESMLGSKWALLVIGVLAPATEEVVFRGALLRKLLTIKALPGHWTAIAISALAFAVLHGNLAQGVNALLMGLVLGWLYYRTGSIVPSLVLHCVNNLCAIMLSRMLPGGAEANLTDLYGGDALRITLALACSLAIALASLYQISEHLSRAPRMRKKQ